MPIAMHTSELRLAIIPTLHEDALLSLDCWNSKAGLLEFWVAALHMSSDFLCLRVHHGSLITMLD